MYSAKEKRLYLHTANFTGEQKMLGLIQKKTCTRKWSLVLFVFLLITNKMI